MEFEEQGCDVCGQRWLSGSHPREFFTLAPEQVSFYQCDVCETTASMERILRLWNVSS